MSGDALCEKAISQVITTHYLFPEYFQSLSVKKNKNQFCNLNSLECLLPSCQENAISRDCLDK
jgi:hypothetical protein